MAKILIIEDHSDTRELLRVLLELDGYEVAEAHTGEDGIRLAKQFAPDLVLMDVSLAGEIDGLEVTRQMRADARFDHTVIIALTAHAMKEDRQTTLSNGCDDYWTKPIVDLEKFRRDVARSIACGRNPSHQELGA